MMWARVAVAVAAVSCVMGVGMGARPTDVFAVYKGQATGFIAFPFDTTITFSDDGSRVSVATALGDMGADVTWDSNNKWLDVTWDSGQLLSGTYNGMYSVLGTKMFVKFSTAGDGSRPTNADLDSGDDDANIATLDLTEESAASCVAVNGVQDLTEVAEQAWRVMRPANTKCSDGSEFVFLVRKGAVGNTDLIIEFQGGGACWDDASCALAGDFAKVLPVMYTYDCSTSGMGGISTASADNTWTGATHVFVPYCTQDLHWGDSEQVYNGATFHHHGRKNVQAVLDWTFGQVQNPSRVFVEGCSAGGYGAMTWSAHVAEHYKNTGAAIKVGIDSASAVLTESWLRTTFQKWNAYCSFPRWIKSLDLEQPDVWSDALGIYSLLNHIADYYKDAHFFHLTSNKDTTQVDFYELMNGLNGSEGWQRRQRKAMAFLDAPSNVRVFLNEGDHHCSIMFSRAIDGQISVNGVSFAGWLESFSNAATAQDLPDSVVCDDCAIGTINGCDGVLGSGKTVSDCGVCGGTNDECANNPPLISADLLACAAGPQFPVVEDADCHVSSEDNLMCGEDERRVTSEVRLDGATADVARSVFGATQDSEDKLNAVFCGQLDRQRTNVRVCGKRVNGFKFDIVAEVESCSVSWSAYKSTAEIGMSSADCMDAADVVFGTLGDTHGLNTEANTCGC